MNGHHRRHRPQKQNLILLEEVDEGENTYESIKEQVDIPIKTIKMNMQ